MSARTCTAWGWMIGVVCLSASVAEEPGESRGWTDAIRTGDVAAVKTLIASASLDNEVSTPIGSVTPLRFAIYSRREDIALLLLAAGSSFEATDKGLSYVALRGLSELTAALIDGGHVQFSPSGSGLFSAALDGHYDTVSVLLQAAEERRMSWGDIGREALNTAIVANRSDIALMMIERGGPMDHRTAYAAGRGASSGIMLEILERGIEPNEPLPEPGLGGARTALGFAWWRYGLAEKGSTEQAKAELNLYHLLAFGAEFGTGPHPDSNELKDVEMRAGALYVRFQGLPAGDFERLKFASQYGYIQMVRQARPLLDSLTEDDLEALLVSSLINHNDDIARYLIDNGAPVTLRVLHAAVKHSSPGIVRLALGKSDPQALVGESAPLLATWASQIPSRGADLNVLAELIAGGTDVCELIRTVDNGDVDVSGQRSSLPLEMIEQAAWGCERGAGIAEARTE